MSVQVIDPNSVWIITIDWTDRLADAVTLATVSHVLPTGLTLVSESASSIAGTTTVKGSGGAHGVTYDCEARAVLSNGETDVTHFTLRCFEG